MTRAMRKPSTFLSLIREPTNHLSEPQRRHRRAQPPALLLPPHDPHTRRPDRETTQVRSQHGARRDAQADARAHAAIQCQVGYVPVRG
jgi:hypothetical protein